MPSNFWQMFDVDDMPARSLYPDAPGQSLGTRITAISPFAGMSGPMGTTGGSMAATGSTTSSAAAGGDVSPSAGTGSSGGFLGEPASWWIVLVVLLLALMWIARRLGDAEEFRNIRMSTYNIIIISLAAIVGIGFFKMAFGKVNVPGLSDFIRAV